MSFAWALIQFDWGPGRNGSLGTEITYRSKEMQAKMATCKPRRGLRFFSKPTEGKNPDNLILDFRPLVLPRWC